MKLEQSFEVAAPLDRVWRALVDVEHVAPCLPGAAVTGRNEDGSYNGTFSVRIGPTSASYSGRLEMQDVDEAAHTATMHAQGTDKRGQGGAIATIVSSVVAVDAGRTRVEVSTDYRITGRLARFGRGGMIEDISEKMLRQFADSLQASLADDGGGAGAPGEAPAATADAAPAAAADGAPAAAGEASAHDGASPSMPAPAVATAPPRTSAQPATEISGISLISSVMWTRLKRNPAPAAAALLAVLLLLLRRRRQRRRTRRRRRR